MGFNPKRPHVPAKYLDAKPEGSGPVYSSQRHPSQATSLIFDPEGLRKQLAAHLEYRATQRKQTP